MVIIQLATLFGVCILISQNDPNMQYLTVHGYIIVLVVAGAYEFIRRFKQ
jgi:hypothetical protein